MVASSQSSETIPIGLSHVLREEHQNDLAGPMIERERIVASVYTLSLPGQGSESVALSLSLQVVWLHILALLLI